MPLYIGKCRIGPAIARAHSKPLFCAQMRLRFLNSDYPVGPSVWGAQQEDDIGMESHSFSVEISICAL
jgi:hypothetical protein